MRKIKKVLGDNANSDLVFMVLSGAMVLCFVLGAILHSLSWGATAGLVTISAGLVLGMLIWSFFFTSTQEG